MTASIHPLYILSYVTIVTLWGVSQLYLVPYVVHLLLLVIGILYAACTNSLHLLEEHEHHDDDTKTKKEKDVLSREDAMQFPIVGSISLFSLYLAFKFLDKDMVNLLIGLYFCVAGCLALTMTIEAVPATILPKRTFGFEKSVAHPLPAFLAGPSPWQVSWKITLSQIAALIPSAVLCYYYYVWQKPWYLNNVLGIAFCLQGIERFSLGSYKIAAILLAGLFLYDIFWVFGTDVMVTVAKNLDGPIKILFPRSLERNADGKFDLSLLGLGDIVIPGFFLALLLRFDAVRAGVVDTQHKIDVARASFPRPYFHTALVAYALGLGTTLFVMIQFNAAQPALLYLVPACLGSSFGCALWRGEVKELLAYDEDDAVDETADATTATVDSKKEK